MIDAPLSVGVIAPPWLPVPPPGYGGTELMVDGLCRGLTRLGHHVVLFTIGTSTCPVDRRALFDDMERDRMGSTVEEFRHALAAYDEMPDVDVVHDHTLAGLFVGPKRASAPIVTTMHGPFNDALSDIYRRVAPGIPIVAISHDQAASAPGGIPIGTVIHHGIEVDDYRFSERPDDHLVFLGRMSPDKGVETAIDVARRAGRHLLIAAKMREPREIEYFRTTVQPLLGAGAEYVGEADFDTKVDLLASASALLNPIHWPEPFGLVMIEAMACGTPVVGGRAGAAPEIVTDGRTGWLATDDDGLVAGLARLDQIDRADCRREVIERFSSDRMTADYVELYRAVIAGRRRPDGSFIAA